MATTLPLACSQGGVALANQETFYFDLFRPTRPIRYAYAVREPNLAGPSPMSHPWVESRSHLAAPDKERFARVHRTISAHGDALRAVPGVVGVRPGFRFRDGWITDEP